MKILSSLNLYAKKFEKNQKHIKKLTSTLFKIVLLKEKSKIFQKIGQSLKSYLNYKILSKILNSNKIDFKYDKFIYFNVHYIQYTTKSVYGDFYLYNTSIFIYRSLCLCPIFLCFSFLFPDNVPNPFGQSFYQYPLFIYSLQFCFKFLFSFSYLKVAQNIALILCFFKILPLLFNSFQNIKILQPRKYKKYVQIQIFCNQQLIRLNQQIFIVLTGMIGIIYIQIRAQFKFKVILIIILSVPHQPFIIFMTEFIILHKNQLRQLQMGFITKEGLAQLDRYKYKSGKYSWLDNKLNPFWEWCVKLLPIDMAPNLVTFIGWLFVTMSYVIMLFYDYTFTKEIPNWIFLYASFCVFIYQTLDAIDGKQARRTGSSSPLGQLFDHGCDSFSITFFILGVCQAARLSADEVLIAFIALQTAFYFSNLLEYHTGILMTNVGQAFGVTQTQLICVLIHILTGIFGQKIWDIEIYSGTQLKSVIIYLVASIIILSSLFTYLQFVVSSNQKLTNLSQIVPLISMFALAFVWVKSSIFSEFCGLIFINFGIYSSLIICKIIISSVTKMKLTTVHYEAGIFVICTILIGLFEYKNNKIAMITVLWVCLIINVINIGKFLSSTIIQITDHLGIYCFSLKRKQKKL